MGHPKETFMQDQAGQVPAMRGVDVLRDPAINKGTAFSQEERDTLGLNGLLPPNVSTLEAQVGRVLENFRRKARRSRSTSTSPACTTATGRSSFASSWITPTR
jgi:hypothetical protein